MHKIKTLIFRDFLALIKTYKTAPYKFKSRRPHQNENPILGWDFYFGIWKDLNRAEVNGAPVEPQSRDRASPAGEVKSRRPH